MKVYCKNCKFYQYHYNLASYKPLSRRCTANPIYEDKYDKKIKIYPAEAEEQNKDNDCSLYKKKWFKFWI